MLKINNKVLKINGDWLNTSIDPYNPLNLPPYTIRLKFQDGVTPTFSKGTGVQVSSLPNIWDLTYTNNDWSNLLYNQRKLTEVLGANSTGVTNINSIFESCIYLTTVSLFDTTSVTTMSKVFRDCLRLSSVPVFDTSNVTTMKYMFSRCFSLYNIPNLNTSNVTDMSYMFSSNAANSTIFTSVPLFDTSKVTTMKQMFNLCTSLQQVPLFDTSSLIDANNMFAGCNGLRTIPLFNTSNITDMSSMFGYCRHVESGALALYQQASSQTNPPINHSNAFENCGADTQTGAAELAQIPSDWK